MIKKRLIAAFFILFIASMLAIGIESYFYIQEIINVPLNSNGIAKNEFEIESGEKVKQIAANLEQENFIRGKDYFEFYVWQKKLSNKLQAGSYDLSPSMSIPQIVNLFVGGKIKNKEIRITIPEGFSNKEIDRILAEKGLIEKEEFIDFDKNEANLLKPEYEFLLDKPASTGLQGYYFPDTYKYYFNSSAEMIARKMLDNFNSKLSLDLREEIKKQNKSIFETITLASIVEKEAKFPGDLKKVASVFQNRLKIGKPLESDATINYITGSGRARSTYEDLKIDSPYNTYKYPGLPPAPISNPGIEAIKAVVYSEKTDYFYFLTTKEEKAIFSKTYEEHLKNKSKYLD